MTPNDLKELREIFRKRMEEVDFCIGQDQVEKLFRELLGEPEPVRELPSQSPSKISAKDLSNAFERVMTPKLMELFEEHDAFYSVLKRK